MSGEIWALLSALGYSGGNVTLRLGQPRRGYDSGMFVTTLLGLTFSLAVVAWQVLHATLPPFSWAGLWLLAAQGFLTAYAGRTLYYLTIHRIGPSRASTFKAVAPLFTLAIAVPALGERLTGIQWLGVAAVIGALFLLTGESNRLERPVAGGSQLAPASPHRRLSSGTALGFLASASFGLGYLVRKLAVTAWPSPYAGMLIGAIVAMAGVLSIEGRQPQFRRLVRETLTGRSHWYYASAACATFAQIASFVAFEHAPAAIAAVLSGTQPILTLLLAVVFLRRSERLRGVTVGAVLLAVAGAAVLSLTGAR